MARRPCAWPDERAGHHLQGRLYADNADAQRRTAGQAREPHRPALLVEAVAGALARPARLVVPAAPGQGAQAMTGEPRYTQYGPVAAFPPGAAVTCLDSGPVIPHHPPPPPLPPPPTPPPRPPPLRH